jgi:hypothetical protein
MHAFLPNAYRTDCSHPVAENTTLCNHQTAGYDYLHSCMQGMQTSLEIACTMSILLENAWIVGTTRHAYILQMLVSHEQGGLRSFLL